MAANRRIQQGVVFVLAFGLSACAGGGGYQAGCQRDPATGMQQCGTMSGGPGAAALTTGLAAGIYASQGCTVNGCELPYRCNPKTKRCEAIRCDEANPCPAGYSCQLKTKLCR
jgi:hypothetical protein